MPYNVFDRLRATQTYAPTRRPVRRSSVDLLEERVANERAAQAERAAAVRAQKHSALAEGYIKKGYAAQFASAYADNDLEKAATEERRRAASQKI